jgi:hypothetical protein
VIPQDFGDRDHGEIEVSGDIFEACWHLVLNYRAAGGSRSEGIPATWR